VNINGAVTCVGYIVVKLNYIIFCFSIRSIEALVKGVERSVQEELSDFPPTAESIRSLLEMKHHLNK